MAVALLFSHNNSIDGVFYAKTQTFDLSSFAVSILGFSFSGDSRHSDTQRPDWSRTVSLPPGTDRSDIYRVGPKRMKELQRKGYIHALKYQLKLLGPHSF